MKRFHIPITILSLLLLPSLTWPQSNCTPAPVSYSITDLGTLGGVSSFAKAINNSGSVTGWGPTAAGDSHPFLWTSSTGMQDLGSLGGPIAIGEGINSTGYVVGYAYLPTFNIHAFLWTPTTGIQDLGSLSGPNGTSFAVGIDDLNRIVGNTSTPSNQNGGDAAIWTGASIFDLGTNGAVTAQFDAINSKFEVAGRIDFVSTTVAVQWTRKGGFKTLPSLFAGDSTLAFALNNHETIAGEDFNPTTRFSTAVAWIRGTVKGLGSLGGGANALGVNDECQIVGYSFLPDNLTTHAFLWTPPGGMQDLNNLIPINSGWVLEDADGINTTGQIAGTGLINGQTHAFLLTPTS